MEFEFSVDEIRKVEEQLDKLGVPKDLSGYKYIRTAVLMILQDFSLIGCMTKVVYSEVGRNYSRSRSRVEIGIGQRYVQHGIKTPNALKSSLILHNGNDLLYVQNLYRN